MGIYVVWLDRTRARIFRFSEISPYAAINGTGLTPPEDLHVQSQMGDQFYREIAKKLDEAPRIALLGPGMPKYHLRYCLMAHYPMLYKKLTAFETMELIPGNNDERIVTFAKTLDPIYLS